MPPYNMDISHCCDSSSPSTSSSRRPLHHPSSSRPLHHLNHSTSNVETRDELLRLAAMELEYMRNPRRPLPEKQDSDGSLSSTSSRGSAGGDKLFKSGNADSARCEEAERSFPPACLALLHALPGNTKCHDCSATSATWASVSYGITLCLQCSGRHRGLGVNCSFIKSLTLDSWKRREILCMLEGGNEQMTAFYDRHGMGKTESVVEGGSIGGLDRYRTKAASFYRQHLLSHAKQIAEGGIYKGREASRKSPPSPSGKKKPGSKHGKGQGGKHHGSNPKGKRKKSRELGTQLPTVAEKGSESSCGTVGS